MCSQNVSVKHMRVCVVTDEDLHRCLTYTTFSPFISDRHAITHRMSITYGSLPAWWRSNFVLHGCLLKVSELVVVSRAFMEQQRIADQEQTAVASAETGSRDTCCTAGCKTERSSRDRPEEHLETSLPRWANQWVPDLPIPVRSVLWCHKC